MSATVVPASWKEWHSTQRTVYHNNRSCEDGNNIEARYLKEGKGGKDLCKRCEQLNGKGTK